MKWRSLLGINESVGGYAEARDPEAVVRLFSTDPSFRSRWPFSVKGAFGCGWDDLQSTTERFVEASRSLSNANRRVIVSNEVDFFEDFVATHGDEIPRYSGSFGNEWERYVASLADVSARFRRAIEKLRSAEALSIVVLLAAVTVTWSSTRSASFGTTSWSWSTSPRVSRMSSI